MYDIRTFAIDKDLRILSLDYRGHVEDPVAYFDSVAQETYGGAITAKHQIEVPAGASMASIRDQISRLGLHPNVEWIALGFPLWIPEDAKYSSHDDDSN